MSSSYLFVIVFLLHSVALVLSQSSQLCCNNVRMPCEEGHVVTSTLNIYDDNSNLVGLAILTQSRNALPWSDTSQPTSLSVIVQLNPCYSATDVEFLVSSSLPRGSDLDSSTFPYKYSGVNSGSFKASLNVDLRPERTSCSNGLKFALHANIVCNCSRWTCGFSSRARSAWASSALTGHRTPAEVAFCCPLGSLDLAAESNSSAFVDDVAVGQAYSPVEIQFGDSVNVVSTPKQPAALKPKTLLAAKYSEPLPEALVELQARSLDDEGTTGEVVSTPNVGSTTTTTSTSTSSSSSSSDSGSSQGSSCLPPNPVVTPGDSWANISFSDTCPQSRKRAAQSYNLQMRQGSGGQFSTIYDTPSPSFTYLVSNLQPSTQYGFRVCESSSSLCSAEVDTTTLAGAGGAGAAVGANGNNNATSSLPAWLIGLIVALIVCLLLIILLVILLLRRRRNLKKKKAVVVADAAVAAEEVVPVVVDEEDEDSFYLDRGDERLTEEKKKRALAELLDEYKGHRILRKKDTSSTENSSGWDSDDDSEYERLGSAAAKIQAAWRGYAVRHPRRGQFQNAVVEEHARAVERLTLAINQFDVLVEQLHGLTYGTAEHAQAYSAMVSLLESLQQAARDVYGDDELPEDIADAINALVNATRSLLSINDGDVVAIAAAEKVLMREKLRLEALLSGEIVRSKEEENKSRTRSWGAFKGLLAEFRAKKESATDEVAQQAVLEEFRSRAEAILPEDNQDSEETADSQDMSMDSSTSNRSSGSWVEVKKLLDKYRAGRLNPNDPEAFAVASGAAAARKSSGERWREREKILERLEMHLEKATAEGSQSQSRPVLAAVRTVPKPAIKSVEIKEAEPSLLDNAPLPWQDRHTGSRSVSFPEEESSDESEDSSEMTSEASHETTGSEQSSGSSSSRARDLVGSPLVKLTPLKFNKRVLKPRQDTEQRVVTGRRNRDTHLSSGSSSHSSGTPSSAENSSEMSFSEDADAPKVATAAADHEDSEHRTPRQLRRRVGRSPALTKRPMGNKLEALEESPERDATSVVV